MAASIWNPGTSVVGTAQGGVISETKTTTLGQTLITLTTFTYTVGYNAIYVYLNGVLQNITSDYTETSSTSITLTNPALAGDTVKCVGVVNLTQLVSPLPASTIELDITAATTTDIGNAASNFFRVIGASTNILSFGLNYRGPLFLRFTTVQTLKNSSYLILPGGADITVAVGDTCIVVPKATAGVADGWVVLIALKSSSVISSVKAYGALGDGVTDDTAAINSANVIVTALGGTLYFPAGTYIATQLNVLAYQSWRGENVAKVIIRLKTGTNPVEGSSALIWSSSLNCDEASFESITFDGNTIGNSQGDTMILYGCRTRIKQCKFINAASNAVTTNFNAASAERSSGIEGSYMDITIDSPQKSAWIHNGPNDSNFDGIIIIDAGKKTNNAYYGMYLAAPYGSGRFNNLHPWNRDSSTNIAAASVYVGSSGNTFTNSHIEGGITALTLAGGANTFAACAFYAPRGSTCINITSTSNANIISGVTGLVYASSNPNYTSIAIAGGLNKIDLGVNGTNSGVFFNDSGTGNNIVTITGYLASYIGQFLYSGTYSTTDVIRILVGGTGGGSLTYPALPAGLPTSATSFTSAITPSSGSFTASIAAAYYYRVGKLVNYDVYYNISSIGTGNGLLQITLPSFCTANALGSGVGSNGLPATMEGHFTAGSINYHSYTNYNGTSPCITAGNGHVAGWYIEV